LAAVTGVIFAAAAVTTLSAARLAGCAGLRVAAPPAVAAGLASVLTAATDTAEP
jgi:hypothetical protein